MTNFLPPGFLHSVGRLRQSGRLAFTRKLKLAAFAAGLLAWASADQAQAQTTVTVGTGTSASGANVLFSTNTGGNLWSKSASLYTASEIITAGGNGGIITKIAWNKQGTGEYTHGNAHLDIYIKEVSKSTQAGSSLDFHTNKGTATLVYSTTSHSFMTGTGWQEFTLQTPFLWNGSSNLEVITAFHHPTTLTANMTWQYTVATNMNMSRVNSTELASQTMFLQSNRPNIQFTIAPSGPCKAPPTAGQAASSVSTICAGASFNLTLSGNSTGAGQTYQWQSSPNGTTGWTDIAGATTQVLTTSQTATNFYRVKVTCSGQDAFSGGVQVTTNSTTVSGNFTIDKTSPPSATNYQSFASAIASITCRSVSGPVAFNVAPGTGPYNEQISIGQVGGASATNTITINGNNNKLSFAPTTADRHIIRLDGADYVTINNLQIESTDATYGWGVHFQNGADNNTLSNCTISVASTSTTEASSAGIVFSNSTTSVTSVGNTGNNNVISGCTITGGYKGIHVNSAITTASNNQIRNNFIRDNYSDGIVVNAAAGTLIEGNDFSRPARTSTSTTYTAIELNGGTKQTLISKNRIHNTHGGPTTKTGAVQAILITGADAPAGEENMVQNNLIYNLNNTGSVYGLYNSGSDGTFFYHNTVAIDNVNNTGLNRGIYQTTAAANVKFVNNIVTINSGATGAKHAIYLGTTTSGVISNNNVLRVTGGAPATSGIGSWGTANQVSISNWRSASSQDINSVSEDPQYANPATGDFTPTNAAVNNIGQNVGVTHDITGLARNLGLPDAGAYEFLNKTDDVGVTAIVSPNSVCGLSGAETVTITVTNFGINPQSNIPVSYTINGGTPVTAVIPGPLAAGATISFSFPVTANLSAAGGYTLVAATNLTGDLDATNNAATKTVTNSLFPALPISLDFESAATGVAAMKVITNSQSAISENTAAGNGAGSAKGMLLEGNSSATWTLPIGSANPWTMNPDHFAATYICFNPAGGTASDSLWLMFDLKQLNKGGNANTNFRITVNGTALGGNTLNNVPANTYRPPFAGSGVWERIKLDLTAYKNDPSVEIGFESSVAEAYANGSGPANLIDNIAVVRRIVSSTKDDFLQKNLTVFPNPSAGIFKVELPKGNVYLLEVTDLSGKTVKTQAATSGDNLLDLEGAAKGIYLLKVASKDGIAVKKLLVE